MRQPLSTYRKKTFSASRSRPLGERGRTGLCQVRNVLQ
jgi:hypothetical protein